MNDLLSSGANSRPPKALAVIINTTPDREVYWKSAINPLLEWVDTSNEIIQVTSKFNRFWSKVFPAQKHKSYVPQCDQRAIVPAISIILFLSEHGHPCYQDIRKRLFRHPWKFHHKIELTSRRTPNFNVARQEYFFLDDGHPLWSVNPVHKGNEHLRVCVFTRNFNKMVEFYRLVTEREMESTKPGFCTFVLFTMNNVDVQLVIKYSPNIQPIPLESTVLFLQIKDIRSIYPTDKRILCSSDNGRYMVADPDGNCVVLQETEEHNKSSLNCHVYPFPSTHTDSNSESQDSGRWSSSVKGTANANPQCPLQTNTSDMELCCDTKLCTERRQMSGHNPCYTLYSYPVSRDRDENFKEVWL